MNITIKQATVDDWEDIKSIRLKALVSDPLSFGSNFEDESKKTSNDWQLQLAEENCATFLLLENKTPVGMTGIAIHKNNKSTGNAILWGSWLEPHLRRQGLSKMMYDARIEWAKNHHLIRNIIVAHRETNIVSKKAIISQGFNHTHSTIRNWSDGEQETEVFYKLEL